MNTFEFQKFAHVGGFVTASLLLVVLIFSPMSPLDCLLCAGLAYIFIGAPLGCFVKYITLLPRAWLEVTAFIITFTVTAIYLGLPVANFEFTTARVEALLQPLIGSMFLGIFSAVMVELIKKRPNEAHKIP